MSFGAAFLVHPDLFPARRSGEPWGDREATFSLPGGPYRFTGLSAAQDEALRQRFGAWRLPGAAAAAIETRLFRITAAEFREVDVRGWEYGLDFDFAPAAVRLAGLRLLGRLDWRPQLTGALWTAEAEGEAFAGACENFFRVLLAYRLREQGGAVLHAAGLAIAGRAFLFLGRSGAGKTTLSRMALERGAEVLSDDLNALQLDAGGPAVAKLPFTGDLGDRRSPMPALPLGALFRLEKSPRDALRPLTRAEAVACLLACSPFVNADPHRRDGLLVDLSRLLPADGDAPAWALEVSLAGGFWSILADRWFPSAPTAF